MSEARATLCHALSRMAPCTGGEGKADQAGSWRLFRLALLVAACLFFFLSSHRLAFCDFPRLKPHEVTVFFTSMVCYV